MRKILCLVIVMVAPVLSGCSGLELYGATGIRRVDEHTQSQRTYRRAMPLKCYFTNCSEVEPENEAAGS